MRCKKPMCVKKVMLVQFKLNASCRNCEPIGAMCGFKMTIINHSNPLPKLLKNGKGRSVNPSHFLMAFDFVFELRLGLEAYVIFTIRPVAVSTKPEQTSL